MCARARAYVLYKRDLFFIIFLIFISFPPLPLSTACRGATATIRQGIGAICLLLGLCPYTGLFFFFFFFFGLYVCLCVYEDLFGPPSCRRM